MLDISARRMCSTAVLLCILLAAQQCSAKLFRPFQSVQAGRGLSSSSSSRREQVLHSMWAAPLGLHSADADHILRSGFKYELQGRNWRLLTKKLATPGSKITVVAFGGSVTVGHYATSENSSWPEEAVAWMQAAFPEVEFTLMNLGHGATTAAIASLCYYQDMPPNPDLVMVEYSINGCGALQCMRPSQPEVAGYENLLRNIMLRAPEAALISLGVFNWRTDVYKGVEIPNAYFSTGEDQHAIIAKRYGVPYVSVRDALFDVLYNDTLAKQKLGFTREEMLKGDPIHPKLIGAQMYGGGFVAWGVRHMVTLSLLHNQHHYSHPLLQHSRVVRRRQLLSRSPPSFAGSEVSEDLTPPPLPSFVSPIAAKQLDRDNICYAGMALKHRPVSSNGWEWVDEGRSDCRVPGCHKYGWTTKTVGASLDFELDTSQVLSQEDRQAGYKVALVIVFLRSHMNNPEREQGPQRGMGVALVSCISGCKCEPLKIDAVNTDRSSELDSLRTQVSSHAKCMIRIKILDESSSFGGHKFRLNGIALSAYTDDVPSGLPARLLFNHLLAVEKFVEDVPEPED
ncbi:hypothetical protein OEZ85_005833 [Tetradesmus obliquus]|uniref:SGNH hydrolase-type esterase domain-containing protein n=1 Tax=Tetradesmus obliquus TaxID=3088 RepID=A0ABY8UIF3_TETOB|nr:hypothetical protein OEZ85_005833 [Tetradesmus obliquus]